MKATTLGDLKEQNRSDEKLPSVKEEIRRNLIRKLQSQEVLFPGIVGYDDTVIPALLNALLSKHNLILLGLRGQAKSRILRGLVGFLDPSIPYVDGCEIHCDPFHPICARCQRRSLEEKDALPIRHWAREDRYVEKLATPDVTIADIIGDLDPIKAARSGSDLSALENMHFGLLPRAHRGIFALNELPDLAAKIQVGLFNIMQEGDLQIKGFPLRLPVDALLVFTANPEDYTARGKIITPLKDRIGSEIKTHYPESLADGVQITTQESWTNRSGRREVVIPDFVREVVENIAFSGRQDRRVDSRSGVSQRLPISCLENVVSNAERRALAQGTKQVVARISDVYASLPAITGKLELEYEGELKGAEAIAEELIVRSVSKTFDRYFGKREFQQIVQWFNLGGQVRVSDQTSVSEYLDKVQPIQGFDELLGPTGISLQEKPDEAISFIEFILEGLHSRQKLNRTPERGFFSETPAADSEFEELEERRSLN